MNYLIYKFYKVSISKYMLNFFLIYINFILNYLIILKFIKFLEYLILQYNILLITKYYSNPFYK